MVIESRHRDRMEFPTVFLLFLITLVFQMVDFGYLANQFKPALVSMMICFWVLHKTETINLGIVWIFGLIVDLAAGSYLGEHAFGKYLVAWFMTQGASRIRLGTLIQQAFYVFAFILIEFTFYWLIGIIIGTETRWFIPLMTASISALLWPIAFSIFSGYWILSNKLFG